jgi:hypothetical protein
MPLSEAPRVSPGFLPKPHLFFLSKLIFPSKIVEKIKTRVLQSIFFFENHAVYETMWKNILEAGRLQMTIWSMRIACWITKATNTHSEYVIIILFQRQQWLRERTLILRCTYSACLVRKYKAFHAIKLRLGLACTN